MSHITIKIDTDNAAFDGDNHDIEVARILKELSEYRPLENNSIAIRDINGNRVGEFNSYLDGWEADDG